MNGVLVIDKPTGLTSHDVVGRVRRIAGIRRVGHSGTLDPAATGVLLLCLGRATRMVEYLVGRPKTYVGRVTLGIQTDSYDADGDITEERPVPALTLSQLDAALEPQRGDIQQVPPMVSAIKKDGKRLYQLAREGKVVEREPRPVTIYRLETIRFDAPHLDIEVECSAGTYIRSIAYDLGEALGCGAHLSRLRRTAVGSFDVGSAHRLEDLSPETIADQLLPIDTAVAHLPRIDLTADEARDLGHGKLIETRPGQPPAELMRVYEPSGRFLGLVIPFKRFWKPKKMLT